MRVQQAKTRISLRSSRLRFPARLPRARFSDFPVLKSILSIDGGAIGVGV
jgi:hypothetical protein